ncbi:hypothetical protein [Sporomusa acidovorans]|uniref:hypothetical protein n=1 Tax=Sporomusa acidovorans TaxID=112900 RepID=UPI000B8203FB|nr:hypothetical protein [Sporomusa acidovorans]
MSFNDAYPNSNPSASGMATQLTAIFRLIISQENLIHSLFWGEDMIRNLAVSYHVLFQIVA